MIKSFGDEITQEFYKKGMHKKIPTEIWKIAKEKLDLIDGASSLIDLESPPGNKLKPLKWDLKGFFSIRINDKYRIIFKFIDGDAYYVSIIDYHK